MINDLLNNGMLISAMAGWFLAQGVKPFVHYARTRRWNWGLWFSAGGMPSSHSALMSATTMSIGLFEGFDSGLFALAMAITMIVVYDAAGVRRQAGMHAERINRMINELFTGQPLNEKQLKEVLGHTPRQVIAGVFFGLSIAFVVWVFFRARSGV
ncbi:MAG: divergent PAP2 family protein [Leptolinea sp.]|nr:divergent PAP2 family protein [Leptolinea sp.]